ncbi:hypothetical protein IWW39_000888 [Coemansia spiralis]|uniref:Uncharacterized protein n=1 Tax=Coemansia spiralis TaxID=417178 RepID=A0A9W8GLP4_9FUNG|nr:hypothetical protein IWW39_000888 [Coemansia spiralis]
MSDSTYIYCIKVCHKIGGHFMTPLYVYVNKNYTLCILVAPDKVVVDGYSWNLRINTPDYFACQLSPMVGIQAHVMEIYDGQALPPLLTEPYDGSAFPHSR